MIKILSLIICGVLATSMAGCSESEEKVLQENRIVHEESVEEPIKKTEEEKKSIDILTIDDKEFNEHMTKPMTDEEYARYFNTFDYYQKIKIEATIVSMNLREGYDTRLELLLVTDKGPYIKVKDCPQAMIGAARIDSKVTITGYNVEYYIDKGYLEIGNIDEINSK